MKKKTRVAPTNPFYSNEPAVSKKLIADQGLTQSASLGNATPKMVDKHPGRLSGVAGFASKGRPKEKGFTPVSAKIPGPAKVPSQGGHLRMSGHAGAHRVGGKPSKLKI